MSGSSLETLPQFINETETVPSVLADLVSRGCGPSSRIWSPLQKRYHSAKKRMSHTLDA